jgi:hypothetical protein
MFIDFSHSRLPPAAAWFSANGDWSLACFLFITQKLSFSSLLAGRPKKHTLCLRFMKWQDVIEAGLHIGVSHKSLFVTEGDVKTPLARRNTYACGRT